MIRGDKPSGYFETSDGSGVRSIGETRQCNHCQFMWQYQPGSGNRRTLCLSCKGLTCGRAECAQEQRELTSGTRDHCIPFGEQQERRKELIYRNVPGAIIEENRVTLPEGYQFTATGIIAPK